MKRIVLPATVLAIAVAVLALLSLGSASAEGDSLTGTLQILGVHVEGDQHSHDHYYLQTEEGTVPLEIAGGQSLPWQLSGEQVTVVGEALDGNRFRVDSFQPVEGLENARTAVADDGALGNTPWVVLMCTFADVEAGYSANWSRARLLGLFTDTDTGLNKYFAESSYGKMNFVIGPEDVHDWETLPLTRAQYDEYHDPYGEWVRNCIDVHDPHVNYANYEGVLVYTDRNYGGVGGGPIFPSTDEGDFTFPYAWVGIHSNQGFDAYLTAHEIMHGFGVPHSGTLDGSNSGYPGSPWDPMSYGGIYCPFDYNEGGYSCYPHHTLAGHKEDWLGWIAGSRKYVAGPGVHTVNIERLANPVSTSNYLIARIPIAGSCTTFFGNYSPCRWYTVEARMESGNFDKWLNRPIGAAGSPTQAVIISKVNTICNYDGACNDDYRPVQVVDPDGSSGKDQVWLVGETFTDTVTGISIKVLSKTTSSFKVKITVPAKCLGKVTNRLGGPGNDTINGTAGNDVINGMGGNDVINGRGGNDTICGGSGNDTLKGSTGNDTLDGGSQGRGKKDICDGGAGTDTFKASCETKKGAP